MFNIHWMRADYFSMERCRDLTMSAVAEVLGTIVEETGRAAAGSHSLKRGASRTDALPETLLICIIKLLSNIAYHH